MWGDHIYQLPPTWAEYKDQSHDLHKDWSYKNQEIMKGKIEKLLQLPLFLILQFRYLSPTIPRLLSTDKSFCLCHFHLFKIPRKGVSLPIASSNHLFWPLWILVVLHFCENTSKYPCCWTSIQAKLDRTSISKLVHSLATLEWKNLNPTKNTLADTLVSLIKIP